MNADASVGPVTPALVCVRFESFSRSLSERGFVASFEVNDDDGARLTLHRKTDGQVAKVEMTGTTEVYFLELAGVYRVHVTAYESSEKWEVIEDFLEYASLFMRRDYVEEILERKGRVLSKTIRLGGEGRLVIHASASPLNRVRRMFGYVRTLQHP